MRDATEISAYAVRLLLLYTDSATPLGEMQQQSTLYSELTVSSRFGGVWTRTTDVVSRSMVGSCYKAVVSTRL
jgi:hypothetical protein